MHLLISVFCVCVCETLLRLRTECFCQHKQDWVYEFYSFPLSTCGHCTKQLTLNTKRFADRAWSCYLQKKISDNCGWNFLLPRLEVQNNYRLTWTRLAGRRPARRIIIRSHAASLLNRNTTSVKRQTQLSHTSLAKPCRQAEVSTTALIWLLSNLNGHE